MNRIKFTYKFFGFTLIFIALLLLLYWINQDINDTLVLSFKMIIAPLFLGMGVWLASIKDKTKQSKRKRSSSFQNSKRILDNLLEKQLLSQTEYNEKISFLKEQENEKRIKKTINTQDKEQHLKIKILLDEIYKLKENNILSKEEYENKKARIAKQFNIDSIESI